MKELFALVETYCFKRFVVLPLESGSRLNVLCSFLSKIPFLPVGKHGYCTQTNHAVIEYDCCKHSVRNTCTVATCQLLDGTSKLFNMTH